MVQVSGIDQQSVNPDIGSEQASAITCWVTANGEINKRVFNNLDTDILL